MTQIKIFQGTRSIEAPRLCDSCANGVVMRGPAESEEYVHCSLMKQPIQMRVTECNRYVDRSQPSLWAMEEIAWVLQSDSKRQKIGFITAKEWRKLNENENLIPAHCE
ncbi:MAG: hypothetical protein JOZ32_04895 [Bryobacterales bacterium]|nr:hypothetical protein [Bryobacterales bacterium]